MILKQGRITSQHNGKEAFIEKAYGYEFKFESTNDTGTWYGLCTQDLIVDIDDNPRVFINKNRVFSLPGEHFEARTDRGLPGDLFLIFIEGFVGQEVTGVKVEWEGRLKYIDGCTDSLLIYAPRLGDPCLNHLHFPEGIDQTFHTHPSIRLGIVYEGSGKACFKDGEVELEQGDIFCIEVDELHRFRTPEGKMNIIAFHPDSDTGPTDEDHPMLNRTIIPKE
jgi:quercetin dioxygenase-like cupin family protein